MRHRIGRSAARIHNVPRPNNSCPRAVRGKTPRTLHDDAPCLLFPEANHDEQTPALSLRQRGLLGTDRGARELRQTVYPRAGASSVSFLQRQTDKRRVKIQPVATNGGNNLTVCGHFCEA